jgi:hypothetical protein
MIPHEIRAKTFTILEEKRFAALLKKPLLSLGSLRPYYVEKATEVLQ